MPRKLFYVSVNPDKGNSWWSGGMSKLQAMRLAIMLQGVIDATKLTARVEICDQAAYDDIPF